MLTTLMLLVTLSPAEAACPAPAASIHLSDVQDSSLSEISGIAPSRRTRKLIWAHQDSGDSARIFALDATTGDRLAEWTVTGASAIDWEDMASSREAGVRWLYVADIGDNGFNRGQVTVWRFVEPVVDLAAPVDGATQQAERIDLIWPYGPQNSETLLVDAANGELVLVGKNSNGYSQVMVAPATPGTHVLQEVGVLDFGVSPLSGHKETTGGAVAPNGTGAVVRTYDSAYYWEVLPGTSVADALVTGTPCAIPIPGEQQGEAIMFNRGSRAILTASEGTNEPIWKTQLQ